MLRETPTPLLEKAIDALGLVMRLLLGFTFVAVCLTGIIMVLMLCYQFWKELLS